jgi:hypothetical protein
VAPRLLLAMLIATAGLWSSAAAVDPTRETPLVRAVRQSMQSVVNIHTEKNAAEERDAAIFRAEVPPDQRHGHWDCGG